MNDKLILYKSLQSNGLIPSRLNYNHYSLDQLQAISDEPINKKILRKLKVRLLNSPLPSLIREIRYNYHKLLHHEPILIYNPGQVGSGSLYTSLKKQYSPVYHIHRLNPLNNTVPYSKQNQKIYEDYIGKRHVKIIVLIRNPINRNLSNFWFHYVEPDKEYNIQELTDMFFRINLSQHYN